MRCVHHFQTEGLSQINTFVLDVQHPQRLILPGVGHFGHCLSQLAKDGYLDAIRRHIDAGKPFMGICVGLQALFEGSAENPTVPGLGIIPGRLLRFNENGKSVPHIGWNSASLTVHSRAVDACTYGLRPWSKYYFVHSYGVPYLESTLESLGWSVAICQYGTEKFIGAIAHAKKNVLATQFHPEKSGAAGLRVLKSFLSGCFVEDISTPEAPKVELGLTRRIIACLDVRANDQGDLVVTKEISMMCVRKMPASQEAR